MKNQHVSLPGLQAAAITFLTLRGVAAEKIFCADANNKVVAISSCDDATPGTFFMFASEEEHPIASTVEPGTVNLHDSAGFTDRVNARFQREVGMQELESGGFGKRACDGSNGS
ncbi:primase zinc finger [Colletotrichum incanum]|uniref:Primase zinc finger n=1 Tax=Colletotrichum incanum TaxID=1573173 RepID=A0A161Y4V5_COLIC|nr:primase zinc finger [Colletotrichum incanum]OHW97722.1 primase zinc finger [Colletotrichum incanum]